MFGVHAKNYRFVKRGVRKSFPSEFSDISSVRQCFSCMILHLFTRLKWGIEASSEIECFPYTMDLKKNLGTQITVFIDSVWYFTKRCNKLHELQTYPYLNLDGGFDSVSNRKAIFNAGLIPNIKENPRNRRRPKRGRKRLFNQAIHDLRDRVERMFAWEDKFKRLLLRFEHLQRRHYGMKLMRSEERRVGKECRS